MVARGLARVAARRSPLGMMHSPIRVKPFRSVQALGYPMERGESPMERYLRVFNFAFRVFGMAGQSPVLLAPIAANIVIAAPFMLGCALAFNAVE